MKNVTIRTLAKMKREQTPIAMITAYDYPSSVLVEEAGADLILVGDSLGMVVLGYDSTIPVTLEDMIHHTKAVTRGAKRAMVIADLPFLVAHLSRDEVLKAAGRLMQEANAYGVKLEGGSEIIGQIQALVQAGVPVMAHLGLQPQSVNKLGGYLIQGKDPSSALHLVEEAKRVEAAGAFALVLECVPEELARQIRDEISIPVIGIGAGRYCDGQVLVFHDVLQMGGGDFKPSFVKTYADVGGLIKQGIRSYVEEVKGHQFPAEEHVSHLSSETQQHLYGSGQKEKEGIS
ncbi:3-methyl-2-oxobutanoate hydroxymethyltransferase [Thermoactinomyces sp. DSM 45891]|uniref:3-methyl-2-oxobutanoate hydroxymethyltransferase n=1 Tax=Thermoactinomyces sp. DSM 45891 TaxID=1761907 RepID=UPI0009153C87|nr:3-methyl-2-oxobutanoate hydroxymethyltransferase [Thermoactinomyces sp. DSM 45891]SFW99888.1 3-methyl-2-oxobutanoate hydroxymethyltransferase [Thermoactinomyces sp. DSM 45891]